MDTRRKSAVGTVGRCGKNRNAYIVLRFCEMWQISKRKNVKKSIKIDDNVNIEVKKGKIAQK